jgi:4a-hydroxytetrahydrobiopterin dehydratase
MARYALSDQEIKESLSKLTGWSIQEGKLHKAYKFSSFAEALGWMVAAGIEAEKMDHHPEWANVYNRVTVNLVTHDLGNVISNLDMLLAQKMDELAK